MTQHQIDHETPLPPCRHNHPARHIEDYRRPSAGGGHVIECRCCATPRQPSFEAALQAWKRLNRIRSPRERPPRSNVVQLNLRLPA